MDDSVSFGNLRFELKNGSNSKLLSSIPLVVSGSGFDNIFRVNGRPFLPWIFVSNIIFICSISVNEDRGGGGNSSMISFKNTYTIYICIFTPLPFDF